jgi:hypothetical protein
MGDWRSGNQLWTSGQKRDNDFGPPIPRSPSLFPKTFPYTKIRIDDSVFGAGPR